MTWAAWLLGLVLPIVKKALVGLGFGFVSYVGVTAALNAVFASMQGSLAGLSGSAVAILALSGFFDFLAIVAGGMSAALGLKALKKLSATTG